MSSEESVLIEPEMIAGNPETRAGASESALSDLLCMVDAPKDGTPILLKFKDDLSQYDKCDHYSMAKWNGLYFVGRNRGDIMEWGFAAPVGQGGFPDAWLDGWLPLPNGT